MLFAPGTNQSYSDYGIGLAGLIVRGGLECPSPTSSAAACSNPVICWIPSCRRRKARSDRIAHVDGPLAEGTDGAMYNSAHARNLAHPAFGTIASARDLLRFALLFDPTGPDLSPEWPPRR